MQSYVIMVLKAAPLKPQPATTQIVVAIPPLVPRKITKLETKCHRPILQRHLYGHFNAHTAGVTEKHLAAMVQSGHF